MWGGVNIDDKKASLLSDLFFDVFSEMNISGCRGIVHDFVMANDGRVSGEKLRAVLGNTPFQDDLEFLDKDTDEGVSLTNSMRYMCASAAMVPTMKVICTDVIHPLICRIRVLEAALANAGKTEEEKH